MATEGWKILQIITAQAGWKAVYCQESANDEMKISDRDVICWALVEAVGANHGRRPNEVRGVVQESAGLAVVEDCLTAGGPSGAENQYFLGYNDPEAHKESDYWIEQAKVRRNARHDQVV